MFTWASLVAQMVKNPSVMWETWVRSKPFRRHDNPLQCSCLENSHGQSSLAGYSPWGHKESDTTERLTHTRACINMRTCWGWSSNTLPTWCEEPTHWKRAWCLERLKAGGGEGDRGCWLDGIIHSMGTSWSKLPQIRQKREAWCAAVHGVAKSQTEPSEWTTSVHMIFIYKHSFWNGPGALTPQEQWAHLILRSRLLSIISS